MPPAVGEKQRGTGVARAVDEGDRRDEQQRGRRWQRLERLQGGNHIAVGTVEDRELRALLLPPLRCLQGRHMELVRQIALGRGGRAESMRFHSGE